MNWKEANMKGFGAAFTYFALGLTGLFAVTASEARDAGALGGGGGGEYRSQCPSGHAWFSYIGNAGTALDGIRALCTSVQPDKTTTGTAETDYHGGSGGSRIQRTCPANSVVTALRVWMEANKLVAEIDLTCTNLQTGAVIVQDGRNVGRPISPSVLFSCNADEIGVGIYGRSGALVDQIGLICEKLTVVQPALAAQSKPIKTTGRGTACTAYGDRMSALAGEARGLGCKFVQLAPWNNPHDYWVNRCVAHSGDGVADSEEAKLKERINECKTAGAGGGTGGGGTGTGAQTLKVVAEVTMYDTYRQPNKDRCYLHPGDTLTKLSADGATGKWLHLSGNSGDCNGKTGYVYNEGELK
jgi:hypothetical protein